MTITDVRRGCEETNNITICRVGSIIISFGIEIEIKLVALKELLTDKVATVVALVVVVVVVAVVEKDGE